MIVPQLALFVVAAAVLPAAAKSPDPQLVAEWAGRLGPVPAGIGRPITDRKTWDAVAASPEFAGVVHEAERLVEEPMPEWTDELYLDFSRTGNRSRYQRVASLRHHRVSVLVLAECLENRGRFLPAIEDAIRETCTEKAWVLPAHDRSLRNFRGETVEVDLASSAYSWELATADYWLGDRLSPAMRKLIRDEVERRTFVPFTSAVTEGRPRLWWLTGTNNWNAVCLAGVTGAAMALVDSPERRAFFAAAAEEHVRYFLSGFTPDGYCSEGVSYWNYGFGNYVKMAETLHQATEGRVDWMDNPDVEQIARFGNRMEILPGVYPAFADCGVGRRPDPRLEAFLSRRYGWGLSEIEREGLLLAAGPPASLVEMGIFGLPNSASARPAADKAEPKPLREWFPDAGILICRPAGESEGAIGVALKGGHNAEHHNHNDVASFVVARDGGTPLVDPGSEVYTARTFSSKRYESNVLNSFGHPVPRVAGQLQRTGRAAAAEVLQTEFTGDRDTVVLDLRAAYDVPQLEKLRRTFVFTRAGQGGLVVTDEVRFDSPQAFETALVTFEPWTQPEPGRLVVGRGTEAVEVRIDAGGNNFRVEAEEIDEDVHGPRKPTRLGIVLQEPVSTATVRMSVTAAETGQPARPGS